jgi:hypothetical protein
MFAKQKSFLASLTQWIGGIGFLLTAALGIYWMFFVFGEIHAKIDTLKEILIFLIFMLCSTPLITSGPLILTLFFLKMFPSILLFRDGIRYQDAIGLSKGEIKWNEIKKIVRYNEKLVLLVIEKEKRILFLDGMYFNKLHALILGRNDIVLFLSSGLEEFDRILSEIIKNSDAKSISEKKPGW